MAERGQRKIRELKEGGVEGDVAAEPRFAILWPKKARIRDEL